jgi:hypothetical protein
MNNKDNKLIWESLQQATDPVSEADTEDPRYAQLVKYFIDSEGASRDEAMRMAKDTIKQMNAKGLKVVHTEPKMRREQSSSPGGGTPLAFEDGRGEHQDAMWTSEGIEEMMPEELLDIIQDELPHYLSPDPRNLKIVSSEDRQEVISNLKSIARTLISHSTNVSHEEGTGTGHDHDPETIKQREIDGDKLERENPQLSYDRARVKREMGYELTDHDLAALKQYER